MDVAASVVGLVGVVETCINLWDIISSGRRVIKDVDTFVLQLQTERVRFILWCLITGLFHVAHEVESAATLSIRHRAVDKLLFRGLTYDILFQHCKSIMTDMQRYLREAEKLLSSYDGLGRANSFRSLVQHRDRDMALVPISQLSKLVLDDEQRPWKRTAWKGVKWTVSGKQSCTRILQNLRAHNDGLYQILDAVDKHEANRLQRWVEGAAATSMSKVLLASHASYSPDNVPPSTNDRTLLALSQLAARCPETRTIGDEDEDTGSHSIGPLAKIGAPIHIDASGLQIAELPGNFPDRQFGSYQGRQVVVEWRYYSTRLSTEGRALLDYRIHAFVLQLNQSSLVPGFNISPCLGSFHSESNARYGLVFPLPGGSIPTSLLECLKEDLKAGRQRDLESRMSLAQSIVRSLLRFFSVGWLHKNIRSSSILFFEAAPDRYSLPEAHLFGFGFARREINHSSVLVQTESFPSVLHSLPAKREWRLYCHPERDRMIMSQVSPGSHEAASSVTSNMIFDAYGLGIILLEIGLWCPAIKICSRDESVEDFQSSVVNKRMEQLRSGVGKRYAEVVRRLLTSDFHKDLGAGEALNNQVFLEAFEKTIVNEIEILAS